MQKIGVIHGMAHYYTSRSLIVFLINYQYHARDPFAYIRDCVHCVLVAR